MPTYAIIGATGATGSALLTHLLRPNPPSPSKTTTTININIYIRSASKLHRQFPSLASEKNEKNNESVHIFEGALTNIPLLATCLAGVDSIFSVIGENENRPGMRTVQESAHCVVAALAHLGWHNNNNNNNEKKAPPRLLFLTSASLNPLMTSDQPALFHHLLFRALSHAYADLTRAEEFLRLQRSWLRVTFIQPGALVEDEERGHKLSLDRKGAVPFVSYLDLAAGMIEVAESEGGDFDGVGVSVVSTSEEVRFEWKAPAQLGRGLVWHYAPSLGYAAQWLGVF